MEVQGNEIWKDIPGYEGVYQGSSLRRFNSESEAYQKRKDFEIQNKITNKYL